MCPLRFILIFFSAVLAAYFAWTTLRSSPDIDFTSHDQKSKEHFSFKKVPSIPFSLYNSSSSFLIFISFFFFLLFLSWLELLPWFSDDSERILGIHWHGQREVSVEEFEVLEWWCGSKELLGVRTTQTQVLMLSLFSMLQKLVTLLFFIFFAHDSVREAFKFLNFNLFLLLFLFDTW